MKDDSQNAIDPLNDLIHAFDRTLKVFASAFSGPSDKLKDVTEEVDHLRAYHSVPETDQVHQETVPCKAGDAIVRARSAPIPGRCASTSSSGQEHHRERRRSDPLIQFNAGPVESMQTPTPPQDEKSGHLALKKRPMDNEDKAQASKSRSLSPNRCARLSSFYDNLGVTDEVDKIEAEFDRKRYDIAVAEVRAGEEKLRRCYDEVCILTRQMKRTRDIASKHKLKADVNKLEYLQRKIAMKIDVMNRIEEKLSEQRNRLDEISDPAGKPILTRRPSSSSSGRVSWHPDVCAGVLCTTHTPKQRGI